VRLLYGVNPDIDYGLTGQEIIRIPFFDEGMHLGAGYKKEPELSGNKKKTGFLLERSYGITR
jgi:hypothetical protein